MKHLILIKVRTADPHVTLKFPFVSMCNKRYISKPENKETRPVPGKTGFPHVVPSFPFWLNPHLERGYSIGIPRKPSYSASFSPLIFPTTLSVSNLSLYL